MDSLGINWGSLQAATCVAILICIVLASFLVQGKKTSRFLLGLVAFLTAWVAIYDILTILFSVSLFVFSIINPAEGFDFAFGLHESVRVSGIVTILLTVVLMAYYISHAAKNPFIPDQDRIYYQAALFFLPFIVMPMYYLKFVKHEFATLQKT